MPLRRSSAACSRGSVQGGALGATGRTSIASSTSSARRPRWAGRAGDGCVCNASMPRRPYALRQCLIVSARTPSNEPICGPVQPAAESSSARARSASARSRECVSCSSVARASSVNSNFIIINRLSLSLSPLGRVGSNGQACLGVRLDEPRRRDAAIVSLSAAQVDRRSIRRGNGPSLRHSARRSSGENELAY